jgi:hypothetical protein
MKWHCAPAFRDCSLAAATPNLTCASKRLEARTPHYALDIKTGLLYSPVGNPQRTVEDALGDLIGRGMVTSMLDSTQYIVMAGGIKTRSSKWKAVRCGS